MNADERRCSIGAHRRPSAANLIPLQDSIIYGPVRSRRLGRSLGLNLFPSDRKVCSFDCIYCHFGVTTDLVRECQSCPVPSISEILTGVEGYLRSEYEFDYLTLSGNGEPTLYPGFAELVTKLKALIGRLRPSVKLALLSNSTTINDLAVLSAIKMIDLPILKLDAGDQATFEALNRPCPGVKLMDIIDGLARLARECRIVLQTAMFESVERRTANGERVPGCVRHSAFVIRRSLSPVRNYEGPAFDHWIAAVRRIRPAAIQLYTTDRPVADLSIRKLTEAELESIAARTRELTGIDCQAY
jgi:wyosine [tRNA(Phe)-imidazoG37] synthetase (radical SAM superfamily)